MKKSFKLLVFVLIIAITIPVVSYAKFPGTVVDWDNLTADGIINIFYDMTEEEIKEITPSIISTETIANLGFKLTGLAITDPAKNAAEKTKAAKENLSKLKTHLENYKEPYNFKDIEDESDLNFWKPTSTGTDTELITKGGKILSIVQAVGTVALVVFLAVIGIKYMIGSASEKAKYKETLVPYIIGAVLLYGITGIATILYKISI